MNLWILLIIFLIIIAIVFVIAKIIVGSEGEYKLEEYKYINSEQKEESYSEGINKQEGSIYLSVIVPAYKEEERIGVMMEETLNYLKSRKNDDEDFTYEILIVDDGSTDNTSKVVFENYVLTEGSDTVRLLTLKKNVGKGGAVRRGMLCGRGEYLLMADADGATNFSDLENLEKKIKEIEKENNAVVCGSRAHIEANVERPWYRKIPSFVSNLIISQFCVKGIKDTQCGFKLFTRKTAHFLFMNMHIERWAFDAELLFLAQKTGIPISEAAVKWEEIDGSKLNVFSASFQMFKDFVRIGFLYRVGFWKIKQIDIL